MQISEYEVQTSGNENYCHMLVDEQKVTVGKVAYCWDEDWY